MEVSLSNITYLRFYVRHVWSMNIRKRELAFSKQTHTLVLAHCERLGYLFTTCLCAMNSATRSWSYFMCICTFLFPEYTYEFRKYYNNRMLKGRVVYCECTIASFISIQKAIAFAITLQEYNILQNNMCKVWIAE